MTRFGKMETNKSRRSRTNQSTDANKNSRLSKGNSVPWGRAASEHRPGLFTKQYLVEHGEACAAEIFRALSDQLREKNRQRLEVGETPIRGCTYNSFAKYWHWFKKLNLIEPTGKEEPSIYDFLPKRRLFRLTPKGKLEELVWEDPIRNRRS